MKILVQHIENLLPEHDCVVVPGLGGFVQNEVQARIQPGARLFYPASKEIGFNHRLKFNDGLLAQSYQETNGLSFEEANTEIQKAVHEIHEKLNAGKFIRLGRIGTLFLVEQQPVFRPDHHNHFYPEAYGLTPFTFPLLKKDAPMQEASTPVAETPKESSELKKTIVRQKKTESRSSKDEFIHLRLSRSRARQLTASVAVLLFFVFLSKPAGNFSESQEAGMMHNYLSAVVQNNSDITPTVVKPVLPTETREAVPIPSVQKDSTIQASIASIDAPASLKGFYIIVSTFVQKETAQRWLKEHEREPILKDARILVSDGRARVFVKHCLNSTEASTYLNKFTASHSEYASAWVYSAKND
ncbi:MAG TPA: hypothetical protein VFP20_02005 [Bacteroidales bacterium]|nr:hypothetical protein [Bacteroidales bacterium]